MKHTGLRTSPANLPSGLIQSFRESVQVCPGERGERIAGLCPVEMKEEDEEKS